MFLSVNLEKTHSKKLFTKELNILSEPESSVLSLGLMGSGKSVTLRTVFFFDYIKNYKNTEYFIFDHLRGANNYNSFTNMPNVQTLVDKDKNFFNKQINYLYLYTKNIISHGYTPDRRIVFLVEDAHSLNIPEKTKTKLNYIFKYSIKTNIFILCTQQRMTIDSLVDIHNIVYVNKRIHKCLEIEWSMVFKNKKTNNERPTKVGEFNYTDKDQGLNLYLSDSLIKEYFDLKIIKADNAVIRNTKSIEEMFHREMNKKKFISDLKNFNFN